MSYLLDSGILLRLADERDELHPAIFQSVDFLISQEERLFTTTQNIAEFWNVATRPIENNGLGLPVARVIEWLTTAGVRFTCRAPHALRRVQALGR